MPDDVKRPPDLSALKIDRDDDWRAYERSRKVKRALWIGIPFVAILVIFSVFGGMSSTTEVRVGAAAILTETQAHSVLSATGYVVAERQASVASKATGRLEYLAVSEGDTVIKGQIIGRIENADMEAALELAKANLEQARANSTEAALEFNRQKELLTSGSTTRQALEVGQARFSIAVAAVGAANASVKTAEVALENTFIRAPFDGTVLIKHADVGEVVAPFASSASSKGAVVDLADMNSLEVEADVSEANIQRVEVGQPCEIILDAYPGVRYDGYVKKIVPTADRSRATVLTKVAFAEIDRRVLPEMSARVNFLHLDSTAAEVPDSMVAVPNSALVMRDGKQMVFTIIDDKAVPLDVRAGTKFGNLTQIEGAIKPGQRVILSPPTNLKGSDKVKVTE
jgi:RND family efflux transporter MFP subunit